VSDESSGPAFERLLDYVRESRGFDFGGYKRTTLLRRVAKRMSQVGVKDYAAYLEYLEAQPGEFAALFNTILINVTSYFRDAAAWEYLQREILPRIIASKAPVAVPAAKEKTQETMPHEAASEAQPKEKRLASSSARSAAT